MSNWSCVDDTVMGGVSQSQYQLDKKKGLLWKGEVSLDNNGGFASIRHTLSSLDLESYIGISLLVVGDGRTYKLNLGNDNSSRSPRFQARFATSKHLQMVYVPFTSLSAYIRGSKVNAEFDTTDIDMIGFLIADKQEGFFQLSVKRISAYV